MEKHADLFPSYRMPGNPNDDYMGGGGAGFNLTESKFVLSWYNHPHMHLFIDSLL